VRAKPSKGLLIGLIGGGVLLLVAIIAVVALVLPSIGAGSSTGDAAAVADIGSEPDTSWKFDWVGDNDDEFLGGSPNYASAGDDQAFIWSSFDYSAYAETQGNSEGWYEGYDQDYEDGFMEGAAYNLDYQIWYDDPTTTYETVPEMEDYFPAGAYDNYEDYVGFNDGFYDAYNEVGYGSSQKVKPEDPDYTPNLTLLNVVNGEEAWTIDLSEAIDDVDYSSSFDVYDVPGTTRAVVRASTTDGDRLVTIDKGNGEVVSEFESDTAIDDVITYGGDVIVAVSDEDGEDSTIGRYAVDALDDDPKWDADVDGFLGMYPLQDFLMTLGGDGEGEILDLATGEGADFGDDIDQSTYYDFAGSQLVRLESDDEGSSYELEGWSTSDDSTWKDSVEAEAYWIDDEAIFVAESTDDGFSDLQRLNLSNGEELWEDAYDDDFDSLLGVQGNSVLLTEGNRIVVVDLGSGEERYSQKVSDDSPNVYEGTSSFYAVTYEELAAFSYNEKGDIWTLDLDDDESIVTLGKHLVLFDLGNGTVHGLEAS
jgi:hypothetical protein